MEKKLSVEFFFGSGEGGGGGWGVGIIKDKENILIKQHIV